MKSLKRITTMLFICLIITVSIPTEMLNITFTVEAHSGRTDSFGGHHDYRNKSGLGYYHYHHGYPAHLHKDGVCPYAGTANTNSPSSTNIDSNSGTSTNSNTTISNITSSNIQSVATTNNVITSTIIISDTSYDNVAFNASYYANAYSDVYEACGDDAKALYNHFITYGINEGRQSSSQFNIFVYKNNNQDLIDAFGDDLIKYYNHYIEYGINENRVSK